MASRKNQFLISLLLIALLSLTAFASTSDSNSVAIKERRSIPPPGSDNFAESFATTTYRDAGATSAIGWGTGSITSPRGYTVQLLDYYSTPDPVVDVDVQGRKAYTVLNDPVSSSQTIRILNITNPYDITLMGDRGSSRQMNSTIIDGDTLYVGTSYIGAYGYAWLGVYNVSNPNYIPSPIDTYTFADGNITSLDVQGHFLYVALNKAISDDFTIFDVEDPNNINPIYNIGFTDLYGVEVEGQLAYLADGYLGLYVRNVSNPYVTTGVSSVNTPGTCIDVLVDGHLVYVADGSSGVQIIDMSDPLTPTIIGSSNTPGSAQKLALQGKTLFVADGTGGVQVLDVLDPTNPINVTEISSLPYTYDVDLYGGDLVVAAQDGVYTYRIGSGMANLPFIGSYDGYEVWDVRVQGDIAYVAAGPDGFLTLDVSDPANPVLLDRYTTGVHHYRKLDVQGHIAYVADYDVSGDFISFDISDPTNIVRIDTYPFLNASDVYVAGEVAYVPFGAGGVCLMNVSNPYNMFMITQWFVGSNTTSCWVQGYHLYTVEDLGGNGVGLRIYDITDISNPVQIEGKSRQSYHYDIFVDGDMAYLADGYWITLYNVTDPFTPILPDEIYQASQWWSMGVWGFGPYVLHASGHGGVQLINTTNVNDIQTIAQYSAASSAIQVTVHGDYAYVANRSSLVILRLFWSAGNTYAPATAQSIEADTTDTTIENATLTYTGSTPYGSYFNWYMSANGGSNWESVTPGVMHTFTNRDNDLRWRAELISPSYQPPILGSVNINYEYNEAPTAPTLTDPGDTDDDGAFTVSWSASTDSDGSVDIYLLQMSTSATFSTIDGSWSPTSTSQDITGFTDGTYYFRVRAVDNDGDPSPWSNSEDIAVVFLTPPIPGFPIEAIALGAVSAISLGLLRRRKHN